MASATRRPGVSGRVRRQRLQLQLQAFLQRARADAGRIEALHELQRREEVLGAHVVLGRDQRRQLLEARLEVAVVVEAVDDHVGECAVTLAHSRHHQLPAQVLLQRRLRLGGAAPVVLFSLGGGRAAARLLVRHDELLRGGAVARGGGRRLGVLLEERVGVERLLHLLRELERGHLEEAQRLLDLRRQREVLAQA